MQSWPGLSPEELLERALPLIGAKVDPVDAASRRDIALVFGGPQAGKTAAICCCCGLHYGWLAPDAAPGRRYPRGSARARPGLAGARAERSPAVYVGPGELCFVELRGVDRGAVPAAEILTAMVCGAAPSSSRASPA
jgi:hypothetical protein